MKINETVRVLICCFFGVLSMSATMASGQSVPANQEKAALITEFETRIAELESLLQVAEAQRESLDEKLAEIKARRRDIMNQQDSLGVSNESFAEVVKSLQTQRVDLMIDLAGLDARRQSMLDLRDAEPPENSPLIQRLEDLLDVEEQQLQETMSLHSQAAISKRDLQTAKRRVLEVQIRLEEARSPSQSASRLTESLWNISLDRAEKQARLEKIESLLNSITSSRSVLDASSYINREMTSVADQMIGLDSDIRKLDQEIQKFQMQLDDLRGEGKKNYRP